MLDKRDCAHSSYSIEGTEVEIFPTMKLLLCTLVVLNIHIAVSQRENLLTDAQGLISRYLGKVVLSNSLTEPPPRTKLWNSGIRSITTKEKAGTERVDGNQYRNTTPLVWVKKVFLSTSGKSLHMKL